MTPSGTTTLAEPDQAAQTGHLGQFELLYRGQVSQITAFFARRSRDPHTVADLTADTFVEAIASFKTAPPRQGAERAWVFAIARHVYAKHCERDARRADANRRAGADGQLADEALEELLERIDAERRAAELLDTLAGLPARDREVLELVDIDGLTPKEAAEILRIPAGTVRVRLFRARARIRKEQTDVQI